MLLYTSLVGLAVVEGWIKKQLLLAFYLGTWDMGRQNKLIFLYLETRHCKCYTLNIMY